VWGPDTAGSQGRQSSLRWASRQHLSNVWKEQRESRPGRQRHAAGQQDVIGAATFPMSLRSPRWMSSHPCVYHSPLHQKQHTHMAMRGIPSRGSWETGAALLSANTPAWLGCHVCGGSGGSGSSSSQAYAASAQAVQQAASSVSRQVEEAAAAAAAAVEEAAAAATALARNMRSVFEQQQAGWGANEAIRRTGGLPVLVLCCWFGQCQVEQLVWQHHMLDDHTGRRGEAAGRQGAHGADPAAFGQMPGGWGVRAAAGDQGLTDAPLFVWTSGMLSACHPLPNAALELKNTGALAVVCCGVLCCAARLSIQ